MHYEPAFVTQAWLSALNLAGILGSTVHLMQVFALDGVSPLRSGRWQFHKLATLKRLSGTAARASRCDRHFPLRCRLRCISAALKSCSVSHGLTSSLRSAKCTEILGHPGHRRLDHACGGLVPFRFAALRRLDKHAGLLDRHLFCETPPTCGSRGPTSQPA